MKKWHRFHHVILPQWALMLIPNPRTEADWRKLQIEAEINRQLRLEIEHFIKTLPESIEIEFTR
jgi:hypothetical protein